MPSRSRSPAPLGAFQPPKSVRHAAISAQNRCHRASRPPGRPCEHKKTASGKWRKAQRQPTTSELRGSANDTKHADVVSRGQNREQDAKMRREVAPKWSGRPLPPVPHLQPPAQRTKGLRGSPGSLARSLRWSPNRARRRTPCRPGLPEATWFEVAQGPKASSAPTPRGCGGLLHGQLAP